MTDIFNEIFTDIATPVRLEVSDTFVTGERVAIPSRFPCVSVVEADNYEVRESIDNSGRERLTALMYEITVYSNLSAGKRAQCIGILSIIDNVMKSKNANRIARIEGYVDGESRIYMIRARYRLKTDGYYLYTF